MIAHLLKVKCKLFTLLNRNDLAHVYQCPAAGVQWKALYTGLIAPSFFELIRAPETLHLLLPSHHMEISCSRFHVEVLSSYCHLHCSMSSPESMLCRLYSASLLLSSVSFHLFCCCCLWHNLQFFCFFTSLLSVSIRFRPHEGRNPVVFT